MPDICQEVVIAAPAEVVFAALTQQKGLAGWWTPNVTAEPAVGTVARFGFGPTYVKQMLVADLEPMRRVHWECEAGASEWVGTSITFQLEAGDPVELRRLHPEAGGQLAQARPFAAGTVVRLTHGGWRGQTPMFAECSYTWGRFLRSLKTFCETGQGHPSPAEHSVGDTVA